MEIKKVLGKQFWKLIGTSFVLSVLAACGGGGSDGSASSIPATAFSISPSTVSVTTTEGTSTTLTTTLTLNSSVITDTAYFRYIDPGDVASGASLVSTSATTATVTFQTETTLTVGTHSGTLDLYACKDTNCNELYDTNPVKFSYTVIVNVAPAAATVLPSSLVLTTEAGDSLQTNLTVQVTAGVSASAFAISDGNNFFATTLTGGSAVGSAIVLTATMAGINQPGTYSGTLYLYLCSNYSCSASNDVPGSPVAVPYTITVTPMALLDPVITTTGLPEWGTYQGNAAHTGYVPTTLNINNFTSLWSWSNPNSATGSLTPVTTGSGKVVVASSGYFAQAYLYGIDEAAGITAWQYSFGSIFAVNHPAVADGRVFVASSGHSDTFLWSFDVNDGAFKYKTAFESQWEHYLAPVVKGGYVYTDGGTYGGMYRFKEKTGALSWFGNLQQYEFWSPAIDDNYAYAHTGYEFAALNLNDGTRAFTVSNSSFNWRGYALNTAPVLPGDGSVLAVDGIYSVSPNHLIRYGISDQNESWRVDGSFSSEPVVANNKLYISNAGTNALEARSLSTGALLWSWIPSDSSETVAVSNLVLTDNLVFISTSKATRAIDLSTHQSIWSDTHIGHLAMSSNRVLYITSGTEINAFRLQ